MNKWLKRALITLLALFIVWQARMYILVGLGAIVYHSETKLIDAAKKNDIPAAEKLLDKGYDINAIASWITSTTALHSAITYGHIEMVKFLLEHGARTDIKAHELPLDLAQSIARGGFQLFTSEIPSWEQVMKNQEEIILLLKQAGAPSEN